MLLSIAMIVKNEESNIDRCLKALKVLDKKIDYEIVIVDTGSIDNTVNIAKKYTNRVYEHKWTNDFSEMRNLSIKYCKGDWILILDADEVLEESKDIINFFESDDYKKNNCATVKFKNILSHKEDNYLIASLVRLFKNKKEFFYTGRVHEQPQLIKPIAITNITFLHYGYSRTDYELMEYKYERNKKLLLKDLEDGKDLIYTYFQLAQTYSMANNNAIAFNYIKKAFNLVKKKKEKKKYLHIYHFLCIALIEKGNYEKSIEVAEEAIKYSKQHLDFYYMLAKSYLGLSKYNKASDYIKEYFNLYNKLENGYLVDDISVGNCSYCKKNEMLRDKIFCNYKQKRLEEVITVFNELTKEADKQEMIEIYIYSLIKMHKNEEILKYYNNMEIKDNDIQTIIRIIQRVTVEEMNSNMVNLVDNLLGLDCNLDKYIKYKFKNEDIEYDKENLDLNDFYTWKGELLQQYYIKDKNVIEYLKKIKKDDIYAYVNYISKDYKCLEMLYKYSEDNFLKNNIETLNLLTKIEEVLLLSNSIEDNKYSVLVKRAYVNKLFYINKVYSKEILESKYSDKILNKYEKIWIEINKCLKYCNNDKLKYIKSLRNILKVTPEYNRVLKLFLDKIDDVNINEHMEKEKQNLLNAVQQLVQENKTNEALEILLQLNDLFKYDFETLNYLGVTYYILQRYDEAIINLALANTIKENNFDTIYNLACVLEANDNLEEASDYYKIAYNLCEDENLKLEIKKIIAILNK